MEYYCLELPTGEFIAEAEKGKVKVILLHNANHEFGSVFIMNPVPLTDLLDQGAMVKYELTQAEYECSARETEWTKSVQSLRVK